MAAVGFVGLGHMGGNMAVRFLAAGYEVYGTARDRTRAQWLLDQGLRWLDTPREIAETVEVVLTSLPNDEVVESVASGPDGILGGLADAEGSRSADAQPVRRGVVRRRADAQGHPPGAGDRARAPRATALRRRCRRGPRPGDRARL